MSVELEATLAELRTETGWLAEDESAYVPHYWNLHKDDKPRDLQSPDEYDGGTDLAIQCTQLDMPASQQRKLVEQWVQVLPTLQGVRRRGGIAVIVTHRTAAIAAVERGVEVTGVAAQFHEPPRRGRQPAGEEVGRVDERGVGDAREGPARGAPEAFARTEVHVDAPCVCTRRG